MSVQYYLNKLVTVDQLKEKDYKVEKLDDEFVKQVIKEGLTQAEYIINDNLKATVVKDGNIHEYEGRFSHGGINTILKICEDFECKFITDEDVENCVYTDTEITEELYISRYEKTLKEIEEWEKSNS